MPSLSLPDLGRSRKLTDGGDGGEVSPRQPRRTRVLEVTEDETTGDNAKLPQVNLC